MSEIRVTQKHNATPEVARQKIAAFETMLRDKYKMSVTWKGNHADLKGPAAKGAIDIDASDVRIEVSLGLLARAVIDPKRAEASIRKRLTAAFEPAQG